jgi:ribosomal protein S18 acetylase RimI-like enzyme
MIDTVDIICLKPVHTVALARFFARVASDPKSIHFHPHPFSDSEAEHICNYIGNDKYVGLLCGKEVFGYGMLRGWDEGFTVPSLGIYVAPDLRGTGAARLLMQYLHLIAKLSGATQVRLKVDRDNNTAYRLYKSMGYLFTDMHEPVAQLLGLVNL